MASTRPDLTDPESADRTSARMRSAVRHQVLTSIVIPAAPDRVWRHLTAFDAYAEWNPFITDASGVLRVGESLHMRLDPPGGRPTSFRPRVTEVEPEAVLAWQGHVGGPWLFAGDHRFELTPIAAGTRLEHGETFTGLLVPLLRRSLDGPTRQGFEAMNLALADRAGVDAS